MMTEFESAHVTEHFKISKVRKILTNLKVKKFRDLNKKWKRTLALMKNRKEEMVEEALNKRMETMENKKSAMEKILKENEEKKLQILEEIKNKNKLTEEVIQTNMHLKAEKIEEERLNHEKKTKERLTRISEHRHTRLQETMENFLDNSHRSLDHFKKNWKRLEESKEKKQEELKAKAFDKYVGWVSLIELRT